MSAFTASVTFNNKDVYFREICEADHDEIKTLHDELFPVKYSDKFYQDICKGKGTNGSKLFAKVAVCKTTGKLVGFILAQFFTPNDCEDTDLFALSFNPPGSVLYILTIGFHESYRRSGLGTQLLNLCVEHANADPTCGAVYLHVIHYNKAGIAFYRKNNFEKLREIPGFYQISGISHAAHVYIMYLHGYKSPLLHRMFSSTSSLAFESFLYLTDFMSDLMDNITSIGPAALMSLNVIAPFGLTNAHGMANALRSTGLVSDISTTAPPPPTPSTTSTAASSSNINGVSGVEVSQVSSSSSSSGQVQLQSGNITGSFV